MDSLQLTNGNDKNTSGRENNYVEILFTEDRDHGIRVNHEMTEALYGYSFVDEDQQQEEKIASSAWCTRKAFTLVLLYLGVFLDAMDVVLLPTSFASLKETMHFSPTALGFSDFLTSIFAATLSLFWGYLADRHSRVKILSAIAVLWGVMSLLVSLSPNGTWFMILRGISGIFLGGLYPVKLSLISDLVGPSARGTAFGIFGVFVAFGQMSGALMVSSLDDWRLSFRITGTMCLVYAVVILSCASEPQRGEADKVEAKAQVETPQIRLRFLQASSVILTNSSVLLIFVAQVCGSGAKVSFHWLMFWLQYKGYSKVQAPLFMSLYEWGRVTGGILGGLAGDKLDKVNPQHGRISLGQVLQIVLMLLILSLFSPFSDVNGIALGSILFLIGMALDPPDSAASKPMLMSVVPPNHRGQAAGWEHVFVKAFGSLIGGPFNGYLAEISGFDTSDKSHSQNIFAVQNAILWTTVVPALISFCAFTLLHWVYPATINQSTVEKVPESDPEAPK